MARPPGGHGRPDRDVGSRDVGDAVPDSFLVVSGDDALTLPLMAIGGRGIVSVASNAVPSEMSRLVELAEANDFPAARKLHRQLFPFLQVNFIESNPIPIKSAMASLGLLAEVYRLPMVPPSAASKERIAAVLQALTRDAHAAAR